MTTDPRFDSADAALARLGRRVVPIAAGAAPPLRWRNPGDVGFRQYRTEPDTGVSIFVYAFPTESAAAAAEPQIRGALLDGARARVVRKGAVIFWLEAPLSLPGRPPAPDTDRAFDAIATALSL